MTSRNQIVAAALFLATIASPSLAGDCAGSLPGSLQAALGERFPALRVPRSSDSRSDCSEDRRRAGQSECLLATSGDFDGDETKDFAIVLLPRKAGGASELVVALAQPDGWSLERPRGLVKGSVEHAVLSTLRPGPYQETEAAVVPGEERRSLQAPHGGVLFALCDSAQTAFFRIDGSWQEIVLSD